VGQNTKGATEKRREELIRIKQYRGKSIRLPRGPENGKVRIGWEPAYPWARKEEIFRREGKKTLG